MKKYIAPVSKIIDLTSEGTLLSLSNQLNNEVGKGIDASNRRGSASSVIWGFDDEAIVEDEY